MASDARNIRIVGATLKIGTVDTDPSSGTDLGYTVDGATVSISRDVTEIQPDELYMACTAVATKLTFEISADLAEFDETQLAKIFPAIGAGPTFFSLSVSGGLDGASSTNIELEFQKCYCPEATTKISRGAAWVFPFKAIAILNGSGAYPTVESVF